MRSTPRPVVWLGAAALAAFQVMGSYGAADNQPDRAPIDARAIVLLLVGPVALVVWERWPLVTVAASELAAGVYVALGYPYGPIFASVVIALFLAVQTGRRASTWLLAALGYAGLHVAHALDSRSDVTWVHSALVAGWLVVVLAVSELVRVRREHTAERARAADEERQHRAGEQRLQLAQELHDVLAHNISLINVQASAALHLLDEQPDRARPALTAIKAASHDALHELRTALDLLRRGAAPVEPAPGLGDLDDLIDAVRAGGLAVAFDQAPAPARPVPAAVELAAYRIVQEALTNVTRHARARSVTVHISYDGGVALEVVDDGIGGRAAAGNGIAGMRERAAALGGTVTAGPLPGRGFRVAAYLPERLP
jgi:signal transduction histidine kinase